MTDVVEDNPERLQEEFQQVGERLQALGDLAFESDVQDPEVAVKLNLAQRWFRDDSLGRGPYTLKPGATKRFVEQAIADAEEAHDLARGPPLRSGIATAINWLETIASHEAVQVQVQAGTDV
jgi:hypothetical protein